MVEYVIQIQFYKNHNLAHNWYDHHNGIRTQDEAITLLKGYVEVSNEYRYKIILRTTTEEDILIPSLTTKQAAEQALLF